MERSRNFKPILVPRYLPGSVGTAVWEGDLKIYNRHRFNVFYAEARVDTKPPKMNPTNYVKVRRLVDGAQRLHQIDNENKVLMRKINYINRTKGRVDTFNAGAYDSTSNWQAHRKRMLEIEHENRNFYAELISVEPTYSTSAYEKEWQTNLQKMEHMSKFTMQIFLRKSLDQELREQPSISGGMQKLGDRPLCFFDFRIRNGVHLGRIIVELYVDYVPVTVQNFLSICKGDNGLTYRNSPIHKIVKGHYFELGDITMGNGKGGVSIYGAKFPEENYTLKHTRAGVLSMVRIGRRGNNSQFSITLSAQEKFDGKRVVFGKVVKGLSTMQKIEDMARKRVGPPTDCIIIEKCGQHHRKK